MLAAQAHLVHVDSVDEVDVAMTDLLRDKKVANATHNIAAYRIVEPDGRLVRPPPPHHSVHPIPNLRVCADAFLGIRSPSHSKVAFRDDDGETGPSH